MKSKETVYFQIGNYSNCRNHGETTRELLISRITRKNAWLFHYEEAGNYSAALRASSSFFINVVVLVLIV